MSTSYDTSELMETQSDIHMLDEMSDLGSDREHCLGDEEGEDYGEDGDRDGFTDVEADADTLASAGMGADEDYWPDTPLGEDYGGE